MQYFIIIKYLKVNGNSVREYFIILFSLILLNQNFVDIFEEKMYENIAIFPQLLEN